jgi:primary-amine oxidase
MAAMELVFADASWQAAIARRGLVGDPNKIQVDPWPAGGFTHSSIPPGHRAVKAICFVKEDATDNGYARPVHGLIAHVDITAKKLAFLEDHGARQVPAGSPSDRYDAEHLPMPRTDLQTIAIEQPDGPSFTVTDGNLISWLGWEFRTGIHPLHALELHQVSIRGRSLLYKVSLADMVVPYGDMDPMHGWKHVLDASEYAMGNTVQSLELGCDCLGEIRYLDHCTISPDGTSRSIKNAICIHEEDANIAWRHTDTRGAGAVVRRNRRLVVSCWFTVGNYDYGVAYHFYPDGNLHIDISLSGIVGVSGAVEATTPSELAFAPRIAPEITSPIHQHLFNLRLDWNLDGETNTLSEQEVTAVPTGPSNPHGTQFNLVSHILESEHAAKRCFAPARNRAWAISSNTLNASTHTPTAYKVISGSGHGGGRSTYLGSPESVVAGRAGFALFNLWATPFTEGEHGAAGDYTAMSQPGLGLPRYTCADRSIVDCDLVTWHTIGVTHVPRPEDWPVMPTEHASLMLVPAGFFPRNPVLDLPKGNGSNSQCAKL